MSLEMKDIRSKLPVEIWAVYKGLADGFDKDESEIYRGVLIEYAQKLIHAAKVTEDVLQREGLSGNVGERR